MTTYLVYAVVYNYIVKELPVKRDIEISQEPIQFWYPFLWKHKALFHIYQISDVFLVRCRAIFIGDVPNRVTEEAKDFLEVKCLLFLNEEYSFPQLFGF